MIRALALVAALVATAAQAGDWRHGSSDAVTQAAKRGDKPAALELGKRYEAGRGGLPCDAGQARRWYSRAAQTTGGRRFVYSSPVGKERYGRMIEVDGGAVSPGLPEAGERLAALRSLGCGPPAGDCRASAVATEDRSYRFLLGPRSALPEGRTHPVRIIAPAAFVSMDRPADGCEIELMQFTFPFRFPGKTPVARDALGGGDVVLATFSWEPPDSVKRRIDGSWLNHFSRYSVKGAPAYGLSSATAHDPIDTSILYSSIEQQVMIECSSIRNEPPQWCRLTSNSAPYLAVETRFRATLLPRWKEVLTSALSIVEIRSPRVLQADPSGSATDRSPIPSSFGTAPVEHPSNDSRHVAAVSDGSRSAVVLSGTALLDLMVDRFLDLGQSEVTYDRVRSIFGPFERMAVAAGRKDGSGRSISGVTRVAGVAGLFGYYEVLCVQDGRRFRLAAQYDLCSSAPAVGHFTFILTTPPHICLTPEQTVGDITVERMAATCGCHAAWRCRWFRLSSNSGKNCFRSDNGGGSGYIARSLRHLCSGNSPFCA